MTDPSPDQVSELLRLRGLIGPAFDPVLTADTLADWWEADAQLSRFTDQYPTDDVSGSFDPRWD